MAVEKFWLFYYEWLHPREWEANSHKPEIPDGMQDTDSIGQNHKTL